MKEAHEGICGEHQGGKRLYQHLLRVGYYWPTMRQDCKLYARQCPACQYHGDIIHLPLANMNPVEAYWPFQCWGLDLIGSVNPPSAKGHIWILTAIEYFTKLIEAVPLKRATGDFWPYSSRSTSSQGLERPNAS